MKPGAIASLALALSLHGAARAKDIDSPARRALLEWIAAFNQDQGDAVAAFDRSHAPWLAEQRIRQLRLSAGGYDLVAIDAASRLWISFRVRQRSDAREYRGTLVVKPVTPTLISQLSFKPTDTAPGQVLRSADRAGAIVNLSRVLRDIYVYPATGARLAEAIRTRARSGDYDRIADGDILATRLTDDLQAISGDRHLSVRFTTDMVPPDPPSDRPPPPPPGEVDCGIDRTTRPVPGVGYLKVDQFIEVSTCLDALENAFRAMAGSKAMIIDLRENHGGSPQMAAAMASYLFDRKVHLDDIYDRVGDRTTPLWTVPRPSGETFTGPVYVLTSRHSFSAAELFCYDLKVLHRITLIGEPTGGGAHLVSPRRLGDHFFSEMPFGRFINPVTKGDWEGSGVEPDIRVDAATALDEALRRAGVAS